MVSFKKYSWFSFAFIITFAQATFINQVHKTVIITLPFNPSECIAIKDNYSNVSSFSPNLLSFYISSSADGMQNCSLVQCDIVNNLRIGAGLAAPKPLTPETVVLNGVSDEKNPAFDSALSSLALVNKSPLMVTKNMPNVMCLIENHLTDTHQKVRKTEPLHDTQGYDAAGIIAIESGLTGSDINTLRPYVFAAVKSNNGNFGDDKSGINVTVYDYTVTKEVAEKTGVEVEKKEYFFNTLDAVTGASNGNKACSLQGPAFTINNGTGIIVANVVDLCWNPYVERLYIALKVINSSDNGIEQGMRALLVGRINSQQKLCFDPIAPDKALLDNNTVVGSCGPDAFTHINKLRSLNTTSGLSYLIVQADISSENPQQSVYALPLCDRSKTQNRDEIMNDPLHGALASKYAQTQECYAATPLGKKLVGRVVANPVEEKFDMPTIFDKAVCVGGNAQLPSSITDMVIVADAVYVSTAESGKGQPAGIFHSQAILDAEGKISAWTSWQRVGGVQEGVNRFFINKEQAFLVYLRSCIPELVSLINLDTDKNVELEKNIDISDRISQFLPVDHSGIQGLFDFPCTKFNNEGKKHISLLLATGHKKIVLVETGKQNDQGIFSAYQDYYAMNIIESKNGTLEKPGTFSGDFPGALVMSGGVLDNLGALQAADFVTDGDNHWLVVAGSRGVAVLTAPDGTGFAQEDLKHGLMNYKSGMSFKMVGNYKAVRRLIAHRGCLYVLTNTSFERIEITPHAIKSNHFKAEVLATQKTGAGALLDVGIYGSVALLATTKGLFKNENIYDELPWVKIPLPTVHSNVFNITSVNSSHSNPFDVQAQVYVSVGSRTNNETEIFRLFVNSFYKDDMHHACVDLVPESIFEGKEFPFLVFKNYREHFITNGAFYFTAASRSLMQKPFLHLIQPKNIKSMTMKEAAPYNVPLNIAKITKNITAIVQNSATGNWLIAGDFGLRIHN